MTSTTPTTSTTALQARLLGLLRDGRTWSREELAEQIVQEDEPSLPMRDASVLQALDAMHKARLIHRISGKELVAATSRGMRGKVADPGDGEGALRVPQDTDGLGVLQTLTDDDVLIGGAEGMSDPLNAALGAGAGRAGEDG